MDKEQYKKAELEKRIVILSIVNCLQFMVIFISIGHLAYHWF
ncbi:MAG TPA: hypothetical protein VIH61_03280 [Waddliaceae bacterium]